MQFTWLTNSSAVTLTEDRRHIPPKRQLIFNELRNVIWENTGYMAE
jgi:hypothetical protein